MLMSKKIFITALIETMIIWNIWYVGIQLLSCVWLFVTPWTAAHQASLSFIISWSLLRLTSIEMVMPSYYLILCRPLLFLPSIFPIIRVFSSEISFSHQMHHEKRIFQTAFMWFYKEIKSVNPKGNQPWIFIGRTVAEAPILWSPKWKSWLIGKGPDAGKDWRQKENGVAEDEMVR